MLGDELGMRVDALRGDPDHRRPQRSERLGLVAVGAELLRANRRVVARVEQKHDALAAGIGEAKGSLGTRELELGRLVTYGRGLGHRSPTLAVDDILSLAAGRGRRRVAPTTH